MPELPEVEVVKLFLEQKLFHKTISKLEILNPKSFIGNPKLAEKQKIVKLSRVGKQLSIYLANELILLVHLKMTGQLIYQGHVLGHPTKESTLPMPAKSTRLIFTFTDNSKLYFNDQRKFGWVKLLTPSELKKSQINLGLDIFDPLFSPKYLFQQLQRSGRPVKAVLLDQHFFAGIGNIYANDALFLAGIHPQTSSNKITQKQAKSIHKFIIKIMKQSVLAGGSTARDHKYLRPDGTAGKNQFFFQVYERKGEPCLNCGTKIKYQKLAGRGTFFCPKCQLL
ncbi:MAG: Formamidopyrimidine-DNA glycosylase [Candidatus Shapirobacteria bacterium GW2011_GWE1_38_10]|uniref:Formamidopyrimidine-DNA glycosylase n=1 Tax=Candidatus Shapirobacteria bacterium GW2011_GWE1_38_10 TaxID=1618488 RepID=A0A0G0I035_9BACT|nr:MAG: Formamidopyrimidine-DNA glycosylase [Candidatus Shapirobacteria bacterium GW2011_GWF2_37_20]KKQ48698.1 MAG: Formamidopyrimidine-DNA glycosylase [Candidatus Shapirobacteria bacterium GW2011_GWE1_38_10]